MILLLFLMIVMGFGFVLPTQAVDIGVHVFHAEEVEEFLKTVPADIKPVVTVPYSVDDKRFELWQKTYQKIDERGGTLIVRLTTRFKNESWETPSKKDIVEAASFLSSIVTTGERVVIIFNEPNHAKEWGGRVDPENYAEILYFALNWFGTERVSYKVLPAGLDAAAPTSRDGKMMDNLTFIKKIYQHKSEIGNLMTAINTHAYPNPGFKSLPSSSLEMGMGSFEYERNLWHALSGKWFEVFITETGWETNSYLNNRLKNFYKQAYYRWWNQDEVKAVTAFAWKTQPGPYAGFSMMDQKGKQTPQYDALLTVMMENSKNN